MTVNNTPTVTFHCKPYVAYWLRFLFGNPVRFPRRSIHKQIFLNSLTKKYQDARESDFREYSEKVEIFICADDASTHGLNISLQLQHNMNRTIEHELKIGLHSYIFAHHKQGVSIDKAVMMFQVQFGFKEEVFSLSAIEDAYWKREKKLKEIFRGSASKTQNHVTAKS